MRDLCSTRLPPIRATLWRQYRGIANPRDGELLLVFESGKTLLVHNTEHERFFYGFPPPSLARELFTLLESRRVECRLSTRCAGLAEDYGALKGELWRQRSPIEVERDEPRRGHA